MVGHLIMAMFDHLSIAMSTCYIIKHLLILASKKY